MTFRFLFRELRKGEVVTHIVTQTVKDLDQLEKIKDSILTDPMTLELMVKRMDDRSSTEYNGHYEGLALDKISA